MNPALRADISEVRGSIIDAAEKIPMPARFTVAPSLHSPSVIVTDSETGRSVQVPLFGYGVVRETLTGLFGEVKKPRKRKKAK